MGRLEDKIAIVTGGNSGIGEATAKLFAQEGATVVITARREDELKRVADEINAAGGKCMYVPGDVRSTPDVENVVQRTDLDCRPCSIYGNKPCLRGDYACLNNITPEMIVEKVDKIITPKN